MDESEETREENLVSEELGNQQAEAKPANSEDGFVDFDKLDTEELTEDPKEH